MKRGFTLIELLIVIALFSVITFTGVAGYSKFNKNQQIVTTGKEFLVNLQQAQTRAINNVKTTAGCNSTTLAGYTVVAAINATTYTINEVYASPCGSSGPSATTFPIKTVNLPSGSKFRSAVNFTILPLTGKIAAPQSIVFCSSNCASGKGALQYTINITTQGVVQDTTPSPIP